MKKLIRSYSDTSNKLGLSWLSLACQYSIIRGIKIWNSEKLFPSLQALGTTNVNKQIVKLKNYNLYISGVKNLPHL